MAAVFGSQDVVAVGTRSRGNIRGFFQIMNWAVSIAWGGVVLASLGYQTRRWIIAFVPEDANSSLSRSVVHREIEEHSSLARIGFWVHV
jgi:hypothetical protein